MEEAIKNAILYSQEPLLTRRYYSDVEMENIPMAHLIQHSLYPYEPSAVDVELLAEHIAHFEYVNLPCGFLGATQFALIGKPTIFISDAISHPKTPEEEGRLRFVVAHECGHVIMQNHLFIQACSNYQRCYGSWGGNSFENLRYACYAEGLVCKDYSRYRWYEWQASTAGAHLLLPPVHLKHAIEFHLRETLRTVRRPSYGQISIAWLQYVICPAIQEIFKVSKATAEIAIERFWGLIQICWADRTRRGWRFLRSCCCWWMKNCWRSLSSM